MKWKKFAKEIRSQLMIFLLILLVVSCFRTALADWNYIPSGSMEPTLYKGDFVWINKTHYGPSIPFANIQLYSFNRPKRGDIITFVPPHTDKLFVKRVIGVPGDSIQISGNEISVNGEQLPYSITSREQGITRGFEAIEKKKHQFQLSGISPHLGHTLSYKVPSHKYFVLGDNRNNSQDSRFWGFVDENQVMGKVTHVALSFSKKRPLLSRFFVPTP